MHINITDLQGILQYALSKNTAIRANRANGSEKALFLQEKYLEFGQTLPDILTNLQLRTLTNQFLHAKSQLALSINSVISVKSGKILFSLFLLLFYHAAIKINSRKK